MRSPKEYIPNKGDIVHIDFNPQRGREQAKQRTAIVLTPRKYSEKTSLLIVCPITTKIKGYLTEVELGGGMKTHGVVLADQVKSFDGTARNVAFVERAPVWVLEEVLEKLAALLEIE